MNGRQEEQEFAGDLYPLAWRGNGPSSALYQNPSRLIYPREP
jgi:hypothetical protein